MKTLIVYTSKSGATKECALLLQKRINNSSVCDLNNNKVDIMSYDSIVLGTGVRMSKIYKPMIKFIKQNLSLLLNKKIGIYLCNGYPDSFSKTVEKYIPDKLLTHATCVLSFGGKQPFSSMGIDEWINIQNVNDLSSKFL